MKVEIQIDDTCKEPLLIIRTAQVTEEISNIVESLSKDRQNIITGLRNEKVEILKQEEIIRIYSENGKVFSDTEKGHYRIRLRLYELEERLDNQKFVRISNSEVVNLQKVESLDLSFAGTICIKLSNGTISYVSRRYVSKMKKILGL